MNEEQRIANGRARYAQLLLRQQYTTYGALSDLELKELDNLKKRFLAGELGAITLPVSQTDQGAPQDGGNVHEHSGDQG